MSKLVTRAAAEVSVHVVQDRVVQRLLEAEKALSVAVGIDQVKLVMNVAAAQEVFAKRQQLGEDVIGYAHAIKTHALARLGELLRGLEKAKGRSGPGRGKAGASAGPAFSGAPTLADLGVTKKVAAVAQQLAALPTSTREAIAQRETTIAKVRRERKAEDGQSLDAKPCVTAWSKTIESDKVYAAMQPVHRLAEEWPDERSYALLIHELQQMLKFIERLEQKRNGQISA